MAAIPRSALLLGLAGLIPFAAAALMALTGTTLPLLPGDPATLAISYGVVILAFMSGVLWGFATRANGAGATLGYVLSVLPALWAFFGTMGEARSAMIALILGFAGLLLLDRWFWVRNLAPAWWMRLRLLLTGVVLACLVVVSTLA